jgi:DNA-directed RNA polymerase subunit RPC12/RpoP
MSNSEVYVCLTCRGIITPEEYEDDIYCPFCGSNAVVASRSEEELDLEEDEFDAEGNERIGEEDEDFDEEDNA